MAAGETQAAQADIMLPDIPALVVNAHSACLLTAEGEIKALDYAQVAGEIQDTPVLLCHAPYVTSKVKAVTAAPFDVLTLFAFVHPAMFTVPTPAGLCKALGLAVPGDMEDQAASLFEITRALLNDLRRDPWREKADPLSIAKLMGLNGEGWPWTPFICGALGETYVPDAPVTGRKAVSIWKTLPEWAEQAPVPPPSQYGVSAPEAEERLHKLLGTQAEDRDAQKQYAVQIASAFQPLTASDTGDPEEAPPPHVVLAEAGTGVGKTLGYLAPTSVWAEKNAGHVWISTYTKNLQRQIDQELDKLYPDPVLKNTHTAIRKGRENYLCLLNLEDTVNGAALARTARHAIGAGIMARWAVATKDGDLTGADFPGWLTGIIGYGMTLGLADRRGECIYSACDHYSRCFVERSVRKAERAQVVVANHALSMITAALARPSENLPTRYIFDEGHHLFAAADSAFSSHLTAREMQDLRRWIRGAEGGYRSRSKGLKARIEDLCAGDEKSEKALQAIIEGAACLASYGWDKRLKKSAPAGPAEGFLGALYAQTIVRTQKQNAAYSLETEAYPVDDSVLVQARALRDALGTLERPLRALSRIFHDRLAHDEGDLGPDMRKRLDTIAASLERRALTMVQPWRDILKTLIHLAEAGASGTPDHVFIDYMSIERSGGAMVDVGLHRHFLDPMKPFAQAMRPHAQGLAITSATLRDDAQSWEGARIRTGAHYMSDTIQETAFSSPFDYDAQTRVLIIQDVNKNSLPQVSTAMRTLFQAGRGGGLGLFTSINRLRAVHGEIAADMERSGLPLYAQHADEVDTGTLIDMFREEEESCLLGTDAVRDGVDVPGRSLRLMIFDRCPWPRPSIIHKARRKQFGGRAYDDMITRLRLKQAFGRLIRRADDQGIFIMLDSALPSKLYDAFPVMPEKVGLQEAVALVKTFYTT